MENIEEEDYLELRKDTNQKEPEIVEPEAETTIIEDERPPEVKKRRIPKKLQENQQRYQEAIERQNRMKKIKPTGQSSKEKVPLKRIQVDKDGMRRVNVNGQIRYVAVKKQEGEHSPTHEGENAPTHEGENAPIQGDEQDKMQVEEQEVDEVKTKPEPIQLRPRHSNLGKTSKISGSKRIPSKYAKEINNKVKIETTKKAKNFSELRRIRDMENIDTSTASIDFNKASVQEIRKLKTVQRKKEMADAKKRESKKETLIQHIIKDDNMSKLSKTIAIKNLSVNSRHKRQSAAIKNRLGASAGHN